MYAVTAEGENREEEEGEEECVDSSLGHIPRCLITPLHASRSTDPQQLT